MPLDPDQFRRDNDEWIRRALAEQWLSAATNDAVVRDLEAIFAECASAVDTRGPACWASGRCCNFDKAEHRLYVTGLEAAYCLVRVVRTDWAEAANKVRDNLPVLTVHGHELPGPLPTGRGIVADLHAAQARGGCPFQVRNLCGVHHIKPLGCRVYFCDRSAQQWQHDLTERLLADLRALHTRHTLEYRYGEWRQMLAMFRA